MHGYTPGRFSFNVKGGRCEACEGDGVKRVEMHFLPDVYVPCEVCHGRRFNEATLAVRYNGLSVADVLDLTVDEALQLFKNHPNLRRSLETLADVGLGYIALGQSSPTLSGGEAQRVKLSRELSKRSTGRTLYILDEPTTGLHFDDIKKLLRVLDRLVEGGNTVIVIEHNLDVIKTADWVIDLGPEGGDGGGRIVAEGTPEQVSAVKESYTGRFLGPEGVFPPRRATGRAPLRPARPSLEERHVLRRVLPHPLLVDLDADPGRVSEAGCGRVREHRAVEGHDLPEHLVAVEVDLPLEDQEVRDRGAHVSGGHRPEIGRDHVGREGHVVQVGEVRDPLALTEPARLLQVGHHDVAGPALQGLPEPVGQVPVLPAADGRGRLLPDAGVGLQVLGRARAPRATSG